MTDHPLCHFHIEQPAPNARIGGPIVWVRGWLVAKPGWNFDAVRARTATGSALGVLGFPRSDLARHFGAGAEWLPAEFLVGVPAADGEFSLFLEARETSGEWVLLQTLPGTVAPEIGAPSVAGGELRPLAGGVALERGPHLPFAGFLDLPAVEPETASPCGEVRVFGWLTHPTRVIRALRATLDGQSFRLLDHGPDTALGGEKCAANPVAGAGRFRGWVDCPAELATPACLRIFAELDDGSAQLCFARWVSPGRFFPPTPPPAALPAEVGLPGLPSGRPRRVLIVLRTLREVDATGRALDIVRHLHAGGRWVARAVATEDGPMRARLEAAGCPVQLIDVAAYFAASGSAQRTGVRRQIWWGHLDAVALFDSDQTWAAEIACELRLPVFVDPVDRLIWPGDEELTPDRASCTVFAPIESDPSHGAHVLRQAEQLLASRHPEKWAGWKITTDISGTTRVAAVVCPAFSRHPRRALLRAARAGVPVITTADKVLAESFRRGELDVVPPNQPLALAHALLALATQPAAAQRRAEAAQRLAAGHHPAEPAWNRWQRLLEGVVAR